MATYQERLIARKRLFGAVCPTLSEAGKGEVTTIPAPLAWDYLRSYWPRLNGSYDPTPLRKERVPSSFFRRFDY